MLFALIVIGCVLRSQRPNYAITVVTWLERELSEQTGLDISWERFSWRGFGGFQITAIDIRDPDGTLTHDTKLPFRWSLA